MELRPHARARVELRYDVFNVFNLSGWLIMTLREVVKIYIFQSGTKRHELE